MNCQNPIPSIFIPAITKLSFMTVIGYARISRQDLHIDNQTDILKAAGAWPIFQDRGISGTVPPQNRKEYQEMIRFVEDHDGEPITLLVFAIDRISRSMVETVITLNDLDKRGVIVRSLSPAESFLNVESKDIRGVILIVLAWAAERERANLIERTKAGIARARLSGKPIGRPRKRIDADEVKRLRLAGVSHEQIARRLDCSTSTVYRCLERADRAGRGLA